MVAGETLRKTAGKAMAIELRVQWKESSGVHQYGLNTTDGVNMVVLMATDTLQQNVGHGATVIDGENAFNALKRQKILGRLFTTFPQFTIPPVVLHEWSHSKNHMEECSKEMLQPFSCFPTHLLQLCPASTLG